MTWILKPIQVITCYFTPKKKRWNRVISVIVYLRSMWNGQMFDKSSLLWSFSGSPCKLFQDKKSQSRFIKSLLGNDRMPCSRSYEWSTLERMWEDTTPSHSGFFVSRRTRTISNLLNKGPESAVLTDRARKKKTTEK